MRTHGSAVFPGAWALHFDDVGAKIREDHARRGTSHDRAEVEDAYSRQDASHTPAPFKHPGKKTRHARVTNRIKRPVNPTGKYIRCWTVSRLE